jgi:hypothetical protein
MIVGGSGSGEAAAAGAGVFIASLAGVVVPPVSAFFRVTLLQLFAG